MVTGPSATGRATPTLGRPRRWRRWPCASTSNYKALTRGGEADMWTWLQRLLDGHSRDAPQMFQPKVLLTEACLAGIANGLRGTTAACHEGIVYLLGRTDGETTLAVTAVRPAARTTRGSFDVDSVAMARVVRSAADLTLHVVGQVHTHPGGAAHSDGDVAGARMKYPGYVSIVLPHYG